MGLETGTYISDLVITNPLGSDAKSTSDDHHRLIKSTIKATFPNITGAMTATHIQLNTIPLLAPIASPTFTGVVTVPTPVNATDAVTKIYADGLAFSYTLPGQAGNAGKFIATDGTTPFWSPVVGNTLYIFNNLGGF